MLQLFLALRCEVQIINPTKCSSEDVAHRTFKEEKISAGWLYLFHHRKEMLLSLMLMLSQGASHTSLENITLSRMTEPKPN